MTALDDTVQCETRWSIKTCDKITATTASLVIGTANEIAYIGMNLPQMMVSRGLMFLVNSLVGDKYGSFGDWMNKKFKGDPYGTRSQKLRTMVADAAATAVFYVPIYTGFVVATRILSDTDLDLDNVLAHVDLDQIIRGLESIPASSAAFGIPTRMFMRWGRRRWNGAEREAVEVEGVAVATNGAKAPYSD